jgi:hypothetical protein
LLQWGRLCELATNFILDKAKFAVKCGRFGDPDLSGLTQYKMKFGQFVQTAPHCNNSNKK